MKAVSLFLFCFALLGQPSRQIDCGSPSDAYFSSNPSTPTTAYTIPFLPLPVTPPGTTDTTLRYGQNFTYTLPVTTPGLYLVLLNFVEPTVSKPGQRVFSVTVQDQPVIQNLDLVAEAGLLVPIARAFPIFLAGPSVAINFTASVRYAVVSTITVFPMYPWTQAPFPLRQEIHGEVGVLQANNSYLIGSSATLSGALYLQYLAAFQNGRRMTPSLDYTVNGSGSPPYSITVRWVPSATDVIVFDYAYSALNPILISQ